MAGNDSLQFARATHEVITTSEEVALDGQPIFDTTNNKLFVGNGTTPLKNLTPLSDYDLVIDSQAKFTSYLANDYRDAKSVLLVNNGVNYSLTNNAEIPQGTVLFESIDGATITLDGYSLNCEAATVRGINFIVNRVPTSPLEVVTFITNATALENVSVTLSRPSLGATNMATIFADTHKCNNCYVHILAGEPFWNGFTLFSDCDEVTNLRLRTPEETYFRDDYHIANNVKIVTGAFGANKNWFAKPFVNCGTVVTDDGVIINGGLTANYINATTIRAESITTSFSKGRFTHVGKNVDYKIKFNKTYQLIFIGDGSLPAQPTQAGIIPSIHSQIIFSVMDNAVDANAIQPIEMPPTFFLSSDNLLWIGTPRITFDNITATDVTINVSYRGIKSDGTISRTENGVDFYIRELE